MPSDVSVTISPPNSTTVTIGQRTYPHAATHLPNGSDPIAGFATFEQLVGVSGLITTVGNAVDLTSDQNVSGVKNFASRPTVSGTPVLLSGEGGGAANTGDLIGVFYPLSSNPSGYITGVDFSPYQTVANSTGISGHLQNQITAIQNNTGDFITGVDLSNYATISLVTGASGYLDAQISSLEAVTGSFALSANTGSFLTVESGDYRYVNSTGDTINGNLVVTGSTSGNSFVLNPTGYVDFQYGIPPHKEGRVFYDNDSHTLCYFNDEADVTVNIGQEQLVRVSNGWTGTLLNGMVVYASGAQGNRPKVYPASALDWTENRHDILGVATHDISTQGYITTAGLVNGLNTTGFSEGDTVYLSLVAGLFSAEMPVAPNHAIKVGVITRSHQNQGQLFVDIDQGSHLNFLHDVRITGVQDDDYLKYNVASGYWENSHLNTGEFLTTGAADSRYQSGYWITGYNDSITGVSISGTSTKTVILYQRDGSTLSASFTDIEGTGGAGNDYFLTGANFNSGDGSLSLYVNDGSVITESLDGRYITGIDLSSYQTIVASTGISGYLQGQISAIDLSPLQTATGDLDERVFSIEGVTGEFALALNTGAFLTTGVGDVRYIQPSQTGDFYPISNPSGFVTGIDLSNYATIPFVTGASGYLQDQLDNQQVGLLNLNNRVSTVEGATGNLASTGYVTGVSGYLQGQITSIQNGTGDFITGVDLSALYSATGDLDVRVSTLEGQTGGFVLAANTGDYLNLFYPLNSNPGGYITGVDLSNYASIGYVTGASGYLQGQISSINLVNLEAATGVLDERVFVLESQTGEFALSQNTGAFLTTGAADNRYALQSSTGTFVTTGQTGNFVTNSQTGAFVTTGQTGSFVISSQTGAFLTTGAADARYALQSATGSFVTTGQTGVFVVSSQTGAFLTTGAADGRYALQSATGAFITSGQTGAFAASALTGAFLTTGAADALYYTLSNGQSISGFATTGFNDAITGMTITGDTTKVITLFQRDGTTVTGSFIDNAGTGGGGGSGASVTISTSPPVSPSDGSLWFNSESGILYIYYDDGNSQQWVASDNNGIGLNPVTFDASASGIFSISGQQISGVDPNADSILFWDDSESKLAHLSAGSGLSINGTVLNTTAGKVAQVVVASTNTPATTSSIIPADNTIPQNTEGSEFITATITPTNASSKLVIEFDAWMSGSTANASIFAIFKDSQADAIYSTISRVIGADITLGVSFRCVVNAGSTSSATYKLRYGPAVAGTVTLLRTNTISAFYNGTSYANFTITEILP